ncbi:MAG: ester cyclase [Parasphingorhabdus sp.]
MTLEKKASQKQTTLTRFLKEVWSEGKVEAVDQYLSASYTIHHDPSDPWDGKTLSVGEFKDRLVQSRAMAPDQVFEVKRMIEDGSAIAAAWTWSGTHLGDIPGFPATGRKIAMSGLTIYDFADNRLCGHWQVADRLSVFQQLSQRQ